MWIGIELFVRTIVGGLFIAAGFAKLSATTRWRQDWLASYELVPGVLIGPIAWAVPIVEAIVGICLVLGAFGRVSVLAAAAILVAVTVAVISALMRRLQVSCGCFGTLGELISWRIVVRNLVLIASLAGLARHGLTATITMFGASTQTLAVTALFAVVALLSWRQHHPRSARDTERVPVAAIRPDAPRAETPPQ
ncbi:MauE/DoxX family redox-associated membrane protein [Nocardia sp. CA-128927]|uniref:MauE/DoxX family redox-associated membrane protein n=1 Tax=Nocardia sp. CA-128927 TaxID=3239975 RepID=UPI003D966FB9